MGTQGVEIFDHLTHLSQPEKEDPKLVWDAFANYFEPKCNFRLSRFQLRDLKRDKTEAIDSYAESSRKV